MTNKYLLIGAAAAGLGLAYVMYKTGSKAVDLVGDAANAINPLNNNNVISQGSDSIYRMFGGKTDPGTDLYWALHGGALDWGGALDPTSENNLAYRGTQAAGSAIGSAAYDGVQAVKGFGEGIGSDAYDTVQDVKKWLGGLF